MIIKKEFFLVFLLACFSCTTNKNVALPKDDGKIEIVVLQINDVYVTGAIFEASIMNPDIALTYSGSIRIDDDLNGALIQYDIIKILPYSGEYGKSKCRVVF